MSELRLYGTVGSSFWDEDYFTARQVREQLDGMSGPLLTVRINSDLTKYDCEACVN
ncbi:hypothetical protein [Paracoccus mutanolyticus]|uniref:hypothetical protein n=1 Tax=Paracoccus mutanolyticus TaxID=1499308 RepID=UPI001672AB92|nr:hypothetical protein [Paracoccus mutanolyticus]